MAIAPDGGVIRQLDRLFGEGTLAGLTETELLRRFARRGDQMAFEALAARHGPMVLGVCRRILGDSHAADDAFQAVFLILVAKAGSIRDGERLGPWLHGVARKVALRARAKADRRRKVERPGVEETAVAAPTGLDPTGLGLEPGDRAELSAALDDEIGRLPEKYRTPVVLCYLEGLTHDQAALQLGWPVGTVRSRMAWAREKLRQRLSRRGLVAGSALLASSLAPEAGRAATLSLGLAPAVPPALLAATAKAALHVAAGQGFTILGAGAISASAAELARGAMHAMFIHKLKVGVLAGVTLLATTGGGMAVALQEGGQKDGEAQAATPDEPKSVEERLRALENLVQQYATKATEMAVERNRLEVELAQQKEINKQLRAQVSNLVIGRPNNDLTTSVTEVKTGQNLATTATDIAPAVSIPARNVATATTDIAPARSRQARALAPSAPAVTIASTPAIAPSAPPAAADVAPALAPSAPASSSITAAAPAVAAIAPSAPAADPFGTEPAAVTIASGGGGGPAMTTQGGDRIEISSAKIMVVGTRKGRKFSAISDETGQWQTYALPEGVDAGMPILNDQLAALMVEGPAIPELAAFDAATGKWYTVELKEPHEGRAANLVGTTIAAYSLGRYVYAFSSEAQRWDVLDLGEGAEPTVPTFKPGMIVVSRGDKIHSFNARTGRWSTLDTGE